MVQAYAQLRQDGMKQSTRALAILLFGVPVAGYVSPQLASGFQAAGYAGSYPYEREIEAAVLRRLETYPGR